MRDEDLPDARQESDDGSSIEQPAEESVPATPLPGLADEIAAFVDDGKTYAQAEFAFQKSRLAFTADRGKSAALLGLFALGFVHLALIGLVVGALFALTPHVTAWGATAIVTGVLLAGAAIMLLLMRRHTREIGDAFRGDASKGDRQ